MAVPLIGTTATSLEKARRHRAELLDTMYGLEGALAAPAAGTAWRDAVTGRLGVLRQAFAEHMTVTEGPDGLYAELLDHAPRLASGVGSLIREHAELIQAIDVIRGRAPSMSTDDLRGWAGDVLRDLLYHRQRGADLVYEAYATDIGGET